MGKGGAPSGWNVPLNPCYLCNLVRQTAGAHGVRVGWFSPCHSSERNRQGSCGDHAD